MNSDRYSGKPLIRLIECYVLKAIGELPQNEETRLTAMEPQLRDTFHQEGTWTQVISATLGFPNEMPETIAQMWRQNQEIARANKVQLEPQRFAEMFVDQNF